MRIFALLLITCQSFLAIGASNELSQKHGVPLSTAVQSLNGNQWLLLPDPKNEGRENHWYDAPQAGAKATKVPAIIQTVFPGYHGVAWYWHDFHAATNPHQEGRWILRFWAVDYRADVWLNGHYLGSHEGEGMFEFDATGAVRPDGTNLLAVRVLNPIDSPIDGYVLRQTPARNKVVRFWPGSDWDYGGIMDSVSLLATPPVRITDVFAQPDWKTGVLHLCTTIHNASSTAINGNAQFSVAPAMSGETLATAKIHRHFAPGNTILETELKVPNFRLWQLNDPELYRATVRVQAVGSPSYDETSVRCGFRDFRFKNGYFQLNGHRIFLKCSHTGDSYPVDLHLMAPDPDMLRRDLINVKMMGFNAIRFFAGMPTRSQLDLCDELGLMVYEESFAAWQLEPSPEMAQRYDHEVSSMMLRDRNHPSIMMWGLLNETPDNAVFRHAVECLPKMRQFDDTRLIMLNSGRTDGRTGENPGLTGLEIWKSSIGPDPNVTYNPTDHSLNGVGVRWSPGQLAFHPGPSGQFSVVRWTADQPGEYQFSVKFTGIAGKTTTDVHVLHNVRALFDGEINIGDHGNTESFKDEVKLAGGDHVDFVVGQGNGNYGGDSTAIAVEIKTPDGKIHNAATDFSLNANPNGPWSYGILAAGKKPDPATFSRYEVTEISGGEKGLPDVIGSLSNPGTTNWQDVLGDKHPYLSTPLNNEVIHSFRTMDGGDGKPLFVSEYGIGSAVDLVRTVKHYEEIGATNVEDYLYYRNQLNHFMKDWQAWNMSEVFGRPEDFFTASMRKMAGERLLGTSALRANPKVVGYSLSGTVDQGNTGEGLFTTWRELKPGTVDAMFDAWAPLRWCLFVNPVNVYSGSQVRCDVVLADEDKLKPGNYPATIRIFGPDNQVVWQKNIKVAIPQSDANPPFALPLLSELVKLNGPSGRYRLTATFDHGAVAAGRDAIFYVANQSEQPKIKHEVLLWGEDSQLAQWCSQHGIATRPFLASQNQREIILMGNRPPSPAGPAFAELAKHVARGSVAIAISPDVFSKGKNSGFWLPMSQKGQIKSMGTWLYHKDEWARKHAVFDGLPTGMMSYVFYRDLISGQAWGLGQTPTVVLCGANDASLGYDSGVMLCAQDFGHGSFILNTLHIHNNLGSFPPADRLLLNLLNWAADQSKSPMVKLPSGFEDEIKAIGYE